MTDKKQNKQDPLDSAYEHNVSLTSVMAAIVATGWKRIFPSRTAKDAQKGPKSRLASTSKPHLDF